MAESGSGQRRRSSTVLIAVSVAVVIVGLFVAGFLVGGASTSPPATPTTTTIVACTSTSSRCIGISSSPSDTVVMSSPFSFTVTTEGAPVTKIKKVGRLPRGVSFQNNHNGTATLAGTPESTKRKPAVGTYHLTFTATFGKGKAKQIVAQTFTLTVVA